MYFCSDERQQEDRVERGGGEGRGQQDVVDLQGNGYFSKLLIISFLCPLNEGYKVNTLYNKAPADASFAHFQRLHCLLLGFYLAWKKTWTSSGGISGILWASFVPLSARPVCISLPALPVNVVSRQKQKKQTRRQRAKESLSLYWTFMWANLCVISASMLQSIPRLQLLRLAPAVEH